MLESQVATSCYLFFKLVTCAVCLLVPAILYRYTKEWSRKVYVRNFKGFVHKENAVFVCSKTSTYSLFFFPRKGLRKWNLLIRISGFKNELEGDSTQIFATHQPRCSFVPIHQVYFREWKKNWRKRLKKKITLSSALEECKMAIFGQFTILHERKFCDL